MTKSVEQSSLPINFKTKSGNPITIGTGSGTKWQWKKKQRPEEDKESLEKGLSDQLVLALKNGYNHIDTAEVYTTHPEVGDALRRSGIKREELWITTKYTPGFRNFNALSKGPKDFVEKALKELDTDYVDLLLIHTPSFDDERSYGQTIESAWKELIDIKKEGKARYIGVSNFSVDHILRTFNVSESPEDYPVVNQIEFHPYLQNQSKGIYDFSKKHSILLEAYGPLTPLFRIIKDDKEIEDHPLKPLLKELSQKYAKTDAQILLKYTLQKGLLPITTSSKEERIRQSLEISEFDLSEEDVEKIDKVGSTFYFRAFGMGLYDEKDV